MDENQVSKIVLQAAIHVHQELGPGLLESVYETALEHELLKRGLRVRRQVPVPVTYDGIRLDDGFRMDLLVEECVVVELKSQEVVPPVAFKILLTYLRFSGCKLGLMINFHVERLVDGFQRVVNKL